MVCPSGGSSNRSCSACSAGHLADISICHAVHMTHMRARMRTHTDMS